jgi:hypothetical protein
MPCRKDQMLNLETNRCVLKSGSIGKRLISLKSPKKSPKKLFKSHDKTPIFEIWFCVIELYNRYSKIEDLQDLPTDYIKHYAHQFVIDVLRDTPASEAKVIKVDNNFITFSFKTKKSSFHDLVTAIENFNSDKEPWFPARAKSKVFNGARVRFLGDSLKNVENKHRIYVAYELLSKNEIPEGFIRKNALKFIKDATEFCQASKLSIAQIQQKKEANFISFTMLSPLLPDEIKENMKNVKIDHEPWKNLFDGGKVIELQWESIQDQQKSLDLRVNQGLNEDDAWKVVLLS